MTLRKRSPFRRGLLMMIGSLVFVAAVVAVYHARPARELYYAVCLWQADTAEERAVAFAALRTLKPPRRRLIGYAEAVVPDLFENTNEQYWRDQFLPLIDEGCGPALLPHLKIALSSNDRERVSYSLQLASIIGPEAIALLPDVKHTFKTADKRIENNPEMIQRSVLEAIEAFGPAARSCQPFLHSLAETYLDQLAKMEKHDESKSKSGNYARWMTAVLLGRTLKALCAMDPPPAATRELMRTVLHTADLLEGEEYLVTNPAITWLALSGKAGGDVLLACAVSTDSTVRTRGVKGLIHAAPFDRRAWPMLLDSLPTLPHETRHSVYAEFRNLAAHDELDGPEGDSVITRLRERSGQENALQCREPILDTFGNLELAPPISIEEQLLLLQLPPALPDRVVTIGQIDNDVTQANSERINLALSAAWLLSYVEPLPEKAVAEIHRIMADTNQNMDALLLEYIIITAFRLGEDNLPAAKTTELLIRQLNHSNEDVSLEAAWALQSYASQADVIVPALQTFIQHTPPGKPRNCAAHTVWKLTGNLDAYMRVLLESMEKEAWHSLWLLSDLGEQAASASDAVGTIADDPAGLPSLYVPEPFVENNGEIYLGMRAHYTLFKLTGDPVPALKRYRRVLAGREESFHEYAADWLGLMGSAARPAIPDLERAARSQDRSIRLSALRALVRIRDDAEPSNE